MGEAKRRTDHLLSMQAEGRVGGSLDTEVVHALLEDLTTSADNAVRGGTKRDVVAVAMLAFAVDVLVDTYGLAYARAIAASSIERRAELNGKLGRVTKP